MPTIKLPDTFKLSDRLRGASEEDVANVVKVGEIVYYDGYRWANMDFEMAKMEQLIETEKVKVSAC